MVLGVLLGLIIGGAVVWLLLGRRGGGDREKVARLEAENAQLSVRRQELEEMLGRERQEHQQALSSLNLLFESTAQRVMSGVAESLASGNKQANEERDSRLALVVSPLERMLGAYAQRLDEFSSAHAGALEGVRVRTESLLGAQLALQQETSRLNKLLGRGDQRGHWGEVQLINVLEISGLHEGIDYTAQVSVTDAEGRRQRPDCVVRVGESSLAIDAKFPFDAFEAGFASEDENARRARYAEHAKALRKHVNDLAGKSYWEALAPAPEFVVCFVPSDFALGVAYDADPALHEFAVRSRVLLTGPSTLLAMLWSVAMVVTSLNAARNAQDILRAGETMVERLRLILEPVGAMGQHLEGSVKEYNKMLRSFESRLLPIARAMSDMGSGVASKPFSDLEALAEVVYQPSQERWGVAPGGLFGADGGPAADGG